MIHCAVAIGGGGTRFGDCTAGGDSARRFGNGDGDVRGATTGEWMGDLRSNDCIGECVSRFADGFGGDGNDGGIGCILSASEKSNDAIADADGNARMNSLGTTVAVRPVNPTASTSGSRYCLSFGSWCLQRSIMYKSANTVP
jgi:hypothetical protein